MKEDYNNTATNVMNILDNDNIMPKITSNQLTPENLDKLNRINDLKASTQSQPTS